jgi:hypothetical protein
MAHDYTFEPETVSELIAVLQSMETEQLHTRVYVQKVKTEDGYAVSVAHSEK